MLSGIDARLGWFYVDVAPTANGPWTLGTNRIGMGRVIAASGQSLAVRMFGKMDGQTATNASLGVTPNPNSAVYATYTDGPRTVSAAAWTIPADGTNYDSTFASDFLRLQVESSGVNCALVGHSRGAYSITGFIPSGSENAPLRAILDEVGGFESFLWCQGHEDSATGMSRATYQGHLSTLFTDITARNTIRGTAYSKILATIPNINTSLSLGTPAQILEIRNAASTWAASNSAVYIQPNDLDTYDGIHASQLGNVTLARHYYRATRVDFGLDHSDAGPIITGATRATASKDIILSVSLPAGATSLVSIGSPQNKFDVFANGSLTSPLALDTTNPIIVGTNTITLRLASVPADTDAFDVYVFLPQDGSNAGQADQIYDNNVDADGISVGRQLFATLSAIKVAAPAVSLTQVGPNLTVTSGAWSSAASGFGQAMIDGMAKSSSTTDVSVSDNTWTIEGRVYLPSTPSGIQVMFGQQYKHWIGLNGANLMYGYFNSSSADNFGTTSEVVSTGAWHHVALVGSATDAKLFLDGVLVYTGPAVMNAAGAGGSAVRFAIGGFSDGDAFQTTAYVDEVAVWDIAKYSANFTPPTSPYVGNESGLRALYHLDGNGNAAMY